MKRVTDTLDLARSNIAERVKGVRPKRGPQNRDGDLELAAEIRRLVDARPTYGYRRIAALIKRERRADGMAPANAKRIPREGQMTALPSTSPLFCISAETA
jgi:putative transposase